MIIDKDESETISRMELSAPSPHIKPVWENPVKACLLSISIGILLLILVVAARHSAVLPYASEVAVASLVWPILFFDAIVLSICLIWLAFAVLSWWQIIVLLGFGIFLISRLV